MSLIVSFQNISNLADISDYRVDVWINDRHIAGPFRVRDHLRSNGWLELIRTFARKAPEDFLETRKEDFKLDKF